MSAPSKNTSDSEPCPRAVLAKGDQAKIRNLLKSKAVEFITLGLSLLDALGATTADLDAVFTTAAKNFLHKLGNEWLQARGRDSDDYRLYHAALVRPRFLAARGHAAAPGTPFIDIAEVPPGLFMMGGRAGEDRSCREPQVATRVTRAFSIGRTVVTQSQWRAVMGTDPWRHTRYQSLPVRQRGDNFPAVYVNWSEAVLFCETLTALEREHGSLSGTQHFRLPTEAEWEYACRAGTTTAYSFGDDPGRLHDHGWFCDNSGGMLRPVAQRRPNPWGLFDMHGNAWEWCSDWYDDTLAGGDDPVGPALGSVRVVRGGIWGYDASYCRSAYRGRFDPRRRNSLYGFRVVLGE